MSFDEFGICQDGYYHLENMTQEWIFKFTVVRPYYRGPQILLLGSAILTSKNDECDKRFYLSCNFINSDDDNYSIRHCTQHEVDWINECIYERMFVDQDEIEVRERSIY